MKTTPSLLVLFPALLLAGSARAGENGAPLLGPAREPVRSPAPTLQEPPPPPAPDEEAKRRLAEVRQGLASADPAQRERAGEALLRIEHPLALETLLDAIPILQGAWKAPLARRVEDLSARFGSLPAEKTAALLEGQMKLLRSNVDSAMGAALIEALLRAGHPRAVELGDELVTLAAEPADALSLYLRYGGDDTLRSLARFATDSRARPSVRPEAVRLLGTWGWGPPRFAIRVEALLEAGREADLAAAAEASLARLFPGDAASLRAWHRRWNRRGAPREDPEIVRAEIEAMLGAEDVASVRSWIRPWNRPGFEWALETLRSLLLDPRASALRFDVVSLFGGIGSPRALDWLDELEAGLGPGETDLLAASTRNRARIAARAGGRIAIVEAERLAERLEALDRRVQLCAVEGLGLIGLPVAVDELIGLLGEGARETVALAAVEALGRMKAAGAVDAMLEGLASRIGRPGGPDFAIRVLEAVERMEARSPSVLNGLLPLLGHEDERVSLSALRLLGDVWRAEAAVAAIRRVHASADRSPAIRRKALETLSKYPPGPASEPLLEALAVRRDASENDPKAMAFHRIAVEHFRRTGTALPHWRETFLAIARDAGARPSGRITALEVLARPEMWDQAASRPLFLEALADESRNLIEEAGRGLRRHPSAEAVEGVIELFPDAIRGAGSLHDRMRYEVLLDLLGAARWKRPVVVPDFGPVRALWRLWWRRHKAYAEFPESDG